MALLGRIALCLSLIFSCAPLEVSPATPSGFDPAQGIAPPVPAHNAIVYITQSSSADEFNSVSSTVINDQPAQPAQPAIGGILSGLISSFLGNQFSTTVASMGPAVAPLAPKLGELYAGMLMPSNATSTGASATPSSHVEQVTTTLPKLEFLRTQTFTVSAAASRQDTITERDGKVVANTSIIYLPAKNVVLELDNLKRTYKLRQLRVGEPSFSGHAASQSPPCVKVARFSDGRTKIVGGLLAHHGISSSEFLPGVAGCLTEGHASSAGDGWTAYIDPITGSDMGEQQEPFRGLPVAVGNLSVLRLTTAHPTQSTTMTIRSLGALESYKGLVPVDDAIFGVPDGYQPSL
jgi:hypothetical protein